MPAPSDPQRESEKTEVANPRVLPGTRAEDVPGDAAGSPVAGNGAVPAPGVAGDLAAGSQAAGSGAEPERLPLERVAFIGRQLAANPWPEAFAKALEVIHPDDLLGVVFAAGMAMPHYGRDCEAFGAFRERAGAIHRAHHEAKEAKEAASKQAA